MEDLAGVGHGKDRWAPVHTAAQLEGPVHPGGSRTRRCPTAPAAEEDRCAWVGGGQPDVQRTPAMAGMRPISNQSSRCMARFKVPPERGAEGLPWRVLTLDKKPINVTMQLVGQVGVHCNATVSGGGVRMRVGGWVLV